MRHRALTAGIVTAAIAMTAAVAVPAHSAEVARSVPHVGSTVGAAADTTGCPPAGSTDALLPAQAAARYDRKGNVVMAERTRQRLQMTQQEEVPL